MARIKVKKMKGPILLRCSRSYSMGKYTERECMRRVHRFTLWHQSCLYGNIPGNDVEFPSLTFYLRSPMGLEYVYYALLQ